MNGSISANATITGALSVIESLRGNISSPASIFGDLVIPTYIDVDLYDGEYTVSPDFEGKTLPTASKTLSQNLTVNPIQVESVSNPTGGRTVYIGGII